MQDLGAPVQHSILVNAAAAAVRVETMAWLRERGRSWQSLWTFSSCGAAALESLVEGGFQRGCVVCSRCAHVKFRLTQRSTRRIPYVAPQACNGPTPRARDGGPASHSLFTAVLVQPYE